jgi:hypothetical protein
LKGVGVWEYPESVFTENKKGEKEVRLLVSRREFVKYQYLDPKTGKIVEKGKSSIILKTPAGEEYTYLIPIKQGKALAIFSKSEPKQRKVWNKDSERPENI